MTAWLLAVMLMQTQVARDPKAVQAEALLRVHFEPPSATSFELSSSIFGGMALSADGHSLYFAAPGPKGVVLKSASIVDGSLSDVTQLPAPPEHLSMVAGESDQLIMTDQVGVGQAPFEMLLINVKDGTLKKVLDEHSGCNGLLLVSPSGKYVATGLGFENQPVGRYPFAHRYAVVSLERLAVEYSFAVQALVSAQTPARLNEQGQGINQGYTDVSPENVDLWWTADDALVVIRYDRPPAERQLVLRRQASGEWVAAAEDTSKLRAFTWGWAGRQFTVGANPGARTLRLPLGEGVEDLAVDAAALFRVDPARVVSAYVFSRGDRVVVVHVAPVQDDSRYRLDVVVTTRRAAK